MTDDIAHIEGQNRGLQVQTSNQRILLAELDKLMVSARSSHASGRAGADSRSMRSRPSTFPRPISLLCRKNRSRVRKASNGSRRPLSVCTRRLSARGIQVCSTGTAETELMKLTIVLQLSETWLPRLSTWPNTARRPVNSPSGYSTFSPSCSNFKYVPRLSAEVLTQRADRQSAHRYTQVDQILNPKVPASAASKSKLPSHDTMEDFLGRYCGLMLFVKEIDQPRYQQICAVRPIAVVSAARRPLMLDV